MRGYSTEQLSFGEGFLDPSLLELDEELSKIDSLLKNDEMLRPFYSDFDENMGRPGTPADVYLRMLFLKFRYGLSYEEVEQEVRERIPWRRFCHLNLMDKVPDSTTLIKLNRRFGEELVENLNKTLVRHLVKSKAIRPRKIRIDSTTIETKIDYPNDVKLLYGMIKTITRTVKSAGGRITNHVRAAKRVLANVGRSLKAKGNKRSELFRHNFRKVTRLAKDTVFQSHKILQRMSGRARKRIRQQLEIADCIMKQNQQKLTRPGLRIPNRIVSFYDPDVRPIRKGKLDKPTEFGRTMQLVQDSSGVIVDYKLQHGNPPDKTQLLSTVKRTERATGYGVVSIATDKGYYSAKNVQRLNEAGIRHISIPKIGRLNPCERRKQKSAWFKSLQRFRCGIEASISMLKRIFSLGKVPCFGNAATSIWVGFSIFSFNLWRLT